MTLEVRVLVVDDEQDHAELYDFCFPKRGWDHRWAKSFHEAIATANDFRPHVVVLDLVLADGNGLELLRLWRGDPHMTRTAIIVVSARATRPDMDRARQAGADDFISKPTTADEVADAIERHLRRRRVDPP